MSDLSFKHSFRMSNHGQWLDKDLLFEPAGQEGDEGRNRDEEV